MSAASRRVGAGRLSTKLSTETVDEFVSGRRSECREAHALRNAARARSRRVATCSAIIAPTGRNPHLAVERARLLSIIQAAGWPIWPLLLCSIAALALIIERLSSLRTVARRAAAAARRGDLGDAGQPARRPTSSTSWPTTRCSARVLAAGLRAVIAEPRITETACAATFESAGRAAVHRLERYLNTLGTIASAAPLLGLMGTVIGMIEIFGSQAPDRRQQPGAAGARHLGRALQHRVRPDDRDPGADVLPLLPRPGRRLHARHGAGRRPAGAAPDALRRAAPPPGVTLRWR